MAKEKLKRVQIIIMRCIITISSHLSFSHPFAMCKCKCVRVCRCAHVCDSRPLLSMCMPLKFAMCNLFDRIFNLHSLDLVWFEIKVQSLLVAHSMLCDMYFYFIFCFHITSSIISHATVYLLRFTVNLRRPK